MSDVQRAEEKSVDRAAPHDSFAPLRVPGFRWFVVSVLTMAMGAQIQGVVVAWQIYAITHDPLSLGMVGLAEAVPFIGLALWAGHVADSLDRRRVALIALVVLFLCALALAMVNRPGAGGALHSQSLRLAIYGVIVICGAARSFLLPARNALSAEVVPRAMYPSSVAWRTGVWQVAAVTGPALGGLIYGWLGAGVAYSIAAVLMAAALGAVFRIRVRERAPRPGVRAAGAQPARGRPVHLPAQAVPGRDDAGPVRGALRRRGRDPAGVRRGDPARGPAGAGLPAHRAGDRRGRHVGGAGAAAGAAARGPDVPVGGGGVRPVHDRVRGVALVLAVAGAARGQRRRRHAQRLRAQHADPDCGCRRRCWGGFRR